MAEIKAFTLRNIPITPRAIVLFEHDGTKRLFSHEVEIARISPCGELQKVARAPYGNKVGDFFHERDFGDKTKSLLSPLVTGSKSSSVSAQEVS